MAESDERYGAYELESPIGVGGMAQAWRAWKFIQVGAREVPTKRCLKQVLQPYDTDEEFLKSFRDEAIRTAQLHHENIVQVHDFVHVGGHYFMELELIEGVNLSELLEAKRKVDPEIVKLLGIKLAKALQYAHGVLLDSGERGIVHLDVSPSNVLLSEHGAIKLADFGIAKALSGSVLGKASRNPVGKLPYMAPERFNRQLQTDARADLFSLGVLLFECAAGKRPFDGDDEATTIGNIINDQPLRLEEEAPELEPELREIIHDLIATDLDKRIGSAGEVLQRLMQIEPSVGAQERLGVMVKEIKPEPTTRKLRIADPKTQSFVAGQAVDLQLGTNGKKMGPLTWSARDLPPGLEIDPHSGLVHGVLTTESEGRYEARVSVSDGIFEPSRRVLWEIAPKPTRWQSLLASLRAIPKTVAAWDTTQRVMFGALALVLLVGVGWGIKRIVFPPKPDPLVLLSPGFQTHVEGETVSLQLRVTNAGDDVVEYSATGLPKGISLDPSSGAISGTIAVGTTGVHPVAVVATAGKRTSERSFGWQIKAPPVVDAGEPDAPIEDAAVPGEDAGADAGDVDAGPPPKGCLKVVVLYYADEIQVDKKPYKPKGSGAKACMPVSPGRHVARARVGDGPWIVATKKVPPGKTRKVDIKMP